MAKKLRTSILAAIGMLVLILDTKTALHGASAGLQLCIQTIIPSLVPFFPLSILLTSALLGESIPFLRPFVRLCGIPKGAESLLLVGILGGYPAGAQSVAQAYRDGAISKTTAQRMLPFCNLAGPAFLFGIVSGKFTSAYVAWALWGIHILSAILVSIVLPGRCTDNGVLKPGKTLTVTNALQRSLRIMAGVCGWIIVFRVILAFLERWFLWFLPPTVQAAIEGVLELSNGCCDLRIIGSEGLRFIVSAGMLAFGGLCVFMQTASVTEGLSLETYFNGKLLQVLFSVVLAGGLQYLLFSRDERVHYSILLWIGTVAVIGFCVKYLHKKQKNSSISQPVGV